MISLGIMKRRLGHVLLGLFLIAQLAGIVPLIGVHLQHVMASHQDVADDAASTGVAGHAHHHHSHQGSGGHDHATDPNDQCCTLHHHLAGVLPNAAGADVNGIWITALVSLPPRALLPADPGLPERPPKLQMSI
jgi:hypothetical protein